MGAMREMLKYIAYRVPGSRFGAPSYDYKLTPGQLAFLTQAIDDTSGGCVMEIGVARGQTSMYLLEHLKTRKDPRELVAVDTFSGFTKESIESERARGNHAAEFDAFRYGDQEIYTENLRRAGHTNFRTVAGDAAKVDFARLGPISVLLLDIDLYEPTRKVLDLVWPHMTRPGIIMVDDCRPGEWVGSLDAYTDFVRAKGIAPCIVGDKGGVIRVT